MGISDISKSYVESIGDENLRTLFIEMLNLIEAQRQIIAAQKEEIQKLKDEINHLKGEQGKPSFTSKKQNINTSISSEQERRKIRNWNKKGKKDNMLVDKQVVCELSTDELQALPCDARFLRYETRIQQDIKLVKENTSYLMAVYFSESKNKTYYAPLPSDYQGYFGPGLKTFVHVMTHVCDVTQSKLKLLLETAGIEISAGSLNNILLEPADIYESERQAILQAGLSGSHCGMDSTGSKQKGQRLYTQIINNELFTVFSSHPSKSRLTVLAALQDTLESLLPMSYNTEAMELLNSFGLAQKDKIAVARLFEPDRIYMKLEVERLIAEQLPALRAKENMFHRLLEALAIGYYHQQTTHAKVERLITDDAGEYKMIAITHALCWVHDARFYKKLTPFIEAHRQMVDDFTKQYWVYYHKLLDYKASPNKSKAKKLEKEFERIFTQQTAYFQLNQRIEKTYENKDKLLAVLKCPFIPLHNNAAELAARRVVTKRKISLHTITDTGTKVRDAAMSVVETAKKLHVNVIDYLQDRISGTYRMTALADLIRNTS